MSVIASWAKRYFAGENKIWTYFVILWTINIILTNPTFSRLRKAWVLLSGKALLGPWLGTDPSMDGY